MTEDAKQLKNTLEGLITEFRKTYFKVIFSRKNIKLTETLSISDKLPELFTIIKKYIRNRHRKRLADNERCWVSI